MTGRSAPRTPIISRPLTTLAMCTSIALSAAIFLPGCGDSGAKPDVSEHQGKLCPPGGCDPEDPPPTGTIDPPPQNLRLDGASEYGAAIRFDCAPSAVDHYLYRKELGWDAAPVLQFHIPSCNGASPTVFDNNGQPDTSYEYQIMASNSTDVAWSSILSVHTPIPTAPPLAPSISATAKSRSEIEVKVTDRSQNEGGFRVWRRKLGDMDWSLFKTSYRTDGTGRPLKGHRGTGGIINVYDTGRETNTTYEYKAAAFHAWGESTPVTTRQTTLPYPPVAPSAPTIGDKTSSSIAISWNDPNFEEDGYRVLWGTSTSAPTNSRSLAKDTTSHTVSGLYAGTQYCFWVEAYNRGGTARSGSKCATTVPWPPPGPDVYVHWMGMTPATLPDPGEALAFSWRVCNIGGTATGSFNVLTRLVNSSGSVLHTDNQAVPAQSPGYCWNDGVNHSGLGVGDYAWEIFVDSNLQVSESNEGNNYTRYGFSVR